jgi:xanthine/uracil permease
MKPFLIAWTRGISIGAFCFCLSLVIGLLGIMGAMLPPVVAVPILVVIGPPIIYWASRWLAPDLFGEARAWWTRRAQSKE